jgi:hypothetical protein
LLTSRVKIRAKKRKGRRKIQYFPLKALITLQYSLCVHTVKSQDIDLVYQIPECITFAFSNRESFFSLPNPWGVTLKSSQVEFTLNFSSSNSKKVYQLTFYLRNSYQC